MAEQSVGVGPAGQPGQGITIERCGWRLAAQQEAGGEAGAGLKFDTGQETLRDLARRRAALQGMPPEGQAAGIGGAAQGGSVKPGQ